MIVEESGNSLVQQSSVSVDAFDVSDEELNATKSIVSKDVYQTIAELPFNRDVLHIEDSSRLCVYDDGLSSASPHVQNVTIEGSSNVRVGNLTIIHDGVNVYRGNENQSNPDCDPKDLLKKAQNPSKDIAVKKDFLVISLIKQKSIRLLCMVLGVLAVLGASLLVYYAIHYALKPSAEVLPVSEPSDELGYGIQLIKRSEWLAREPLNVTKLSGPVKIVRIMHTGGTPCKDYQHCAQGVAAMQSWQVSSQDMPDLAYNYMIGGDGNVYIGRGPDVENEWMPKAMDITYMGNFITHFDEMSDKMELAGRLLIQYLLQNGYITKDYVVIAQNQTMNTLSPGQNIYKRIVKWPHFDKSKYF